MNDFESIYNTYLKDVFRYSKSLCLDEQMAEEITEETFFRALRSLGSFRGECEVRVWLCGIARNVWLSEQKKRSRFDDGDDALERLGDGRDLAAEFADRDTARRLHRVLHGLEEPYKEVFSLRVFGELPFKEIGELFCKSGHWACVTYHRAKEKIQKAMGGK